MPDIRETARAATPPTCQAAAPLLNRAWTAHSDVVSAANREGLRPPRVRRLLHDWRPTNRSKKMTKPLTLIAVALFAICVTPTTAVAQAGHIMLKDSPKAELTITYPLAVGNTVLTPGTYKFQCRAFEGGRTFLVVTLADTGKEVARTPCVRDSVDSRVANSAFWTTIGATGVRTLTKVEIAGESVTHRLVDVN